MSKRHKGYSSGSDKNRNPRAKPSDRRRSGAAASTYHRDIGRGRMPSISQDQDRDGRHVRIGVHESKSRSRHPSKYDDRPPSRNRPPPASRSQSARRESSYVTRQPQYEPTRSNHSYSYGVHSAEHGYGPGGCNIYAPPASRPSYIMPQLPSRYDFDYDVVSDDDNLDRVYNAPSGRSIMDVVKVKAKVRQSRSSGRRGVHIVSWRDFNGQIDVTKPCSDNAGGDLIAAAKWYKEATGLKVRAGDIMSMNFRRHHQKVRGRSGHTTIVEAFKPIWNTLQVTHADPRLF